MDRHAPTLHFDLDAVVPAVGVRRCRSKTQDVVGLTLREDCRHDILRRVGVLNGAPARVAGIYRQIALPFQVVQHDIAPIRRWVRLLCGRGKRLEKIGVNRMNGEIGDARGAQERLSCVSNLVSARDRGRNDGNTRTDEQQHLPAFRHVAQRIGHDRHRFERADTTLALAALSFAPVVGQPRERPVDGRAKDAAVGGEVLRGRLCREDDRGKVAGAHLVDGRFRRAPRGRHVTGPDRTDRSG